MDKSKHSSPFQKEKPPSFVRFNALESPKCLIRQVIVITIAFNGLFNPVIVWRPANYFLDLSKL